MSPQQKSDIIVWLNAIAASAKALSCALEYNRLWEGECKDQLCLMSKWLNDCHTAAKDDR